MIKNLQYITQNWWWERNWTQRIIFPMVDLILKWLWKSREIAPKTILIVRLDAIGDYVLFRNFLALIKQSPQFADYRVTFCGNTLWKPLSETFDKTWVDEFVWLDTYKFLGKASYRFHALKTLSTTGYEVILNPTSARAFLREDAIVRIIKATQKIGSQTRIWENMLPRQKEIADKYYTRLVHVKDHNQFEFFINQAFFQNLLQLEDSKLIPKTSFPLTNQATSNALPNAYAVVAPGANAAFRRWSNQYFAQVADFLYENYKLQSVIVGSKSDKKLADEIIAASRYPNALLDLTGKTSLVEMVSLLGRANILIANESGATHIAVATNTPVVCISNGNHFGRFNPYPKAITELCQTVYPQEIKTLWENREQLIKQYANGSALNINSVSPEEVIEDVKKLMEKTNLLEKQN